MSDSTTVRAKFRCLREITTTHSRETDGIRSYHFQALYDPDVPEDRRYAKYTPLGNLDMTVDNDNVIFEPGRAYYLDITPAD